VFAAACGDKPPATCVDCGVPVPDAAPCPLGDKTAPAMLEITHLDASLAVFDTTPGGTVPLIAPPQGGWILLLGARATNIDGCRLDLTVSFRDVCGGPILSLDKRTVKLDDLGNGWGITNVNSYGNLAFCPQLNATHNLHGEPWEVTVELDDADGKHAAQSMTVMPVCPVDNGSCTCQCDHNFVLGGGCPATGPDAGVGCDAGG
jgi:hypothetical protein